MTATGDECILHHVLSQSQSSDKGIIYMGQRWDTALIFNHARLCVHTASCEEIKEEASTVAEHQRSQTQSGRG